MYLESLSRAAEPGPRAEDSLEREFLSLYQDHAQALLRHATAVGGDADAAGDAVQDAFIRYLELRRAGQSVEQPKRWLMTVARNCLIDRLRRARRGSQFDTYEDGEHEEPAAPGNSGGVHDDMDVACLWQQLRALVTPQEFACLELRAAGFTYAEIAGQLGIGAGSVSVYLTRVREKAGPLLLP